MILSKKRLWNVLILNTVEQTRKRLQNWRNKLNLKRQRNLVIELFAAFYYKDLNAPEYCRLYSQPSHAYKAIGTACLTTDGKWEKIMIKNIIIIGLLVIIMTGATASDVVAYIENNQLIDKFSEMLYSIVRSVKENV